MRYCTDAGRKIELNTGFERFRSQVTTGEKLTSRAEMSCKLLLH